MGKWTQICDKNIDLHRLGYGDNITIDYDPEPYGLRVSVFSNNHWSGEATVPLRNIINEGATLDCITVVRCKSCRNAVWSEKEKSFYCKRRWAMHKVQERDYCSYGRRKQT